MDVLAGYKFLLIHNLMVGAAGFEPRPSGPKPDALPDCATPRDEY